MAQRIVMLESVLRTLARLKGVRGVPAKDLAAALSPHLKAQHLVELAVYLESVGAHMNANKKDRKKCAECGSDLECKFKPPNEMQLRFVGTDARYCSAKCKQKAYRKRVTATPSPTRCQPSRVTAPPTQRTLQA